MKILKAVATAAASVVAGFVFFLVYIVVIGLVQMWIFLPKDHIVLLEKFPGSKVGFIYFIFFIYGTFYTLNKKLRKNVITRHPLAGSHKKALRYLFIITNIALLYVILFDVTVITKDRIIDYGIFNPLGKSYTYKDIVKIDTGLYGNSFDPLGRHSEKFYYILELRDGVKVNLNQMRGSSKEETTIDNIIVKLDKTLVDIGIPKTSSTDNLQQADDNYSKADAGAIKSILENVRK